MSEAQKTLVAALAARRIEAAFNGDFLNCKLKVTSVSGRTKWQKWSYRFDDVGDFAGAAIVGGSLKGAYSEGFARDTFYEIIRVGQGNGEAAKFSAECRDNGFAAVIN